MFVFLCVCCAPDISTSRRYLLRDLFIGASSKDITNSSFFLLFFQTCAPLPEDLELPTAWIVVPWYVHLFCMCVWDAHKCFRVGARAYWMLNVFYACLHISIRLCELWLVPWNKPGSTELILLNFKLKVNSIRSLSFDIECHFHITMYDRVGLGGMT